MPIIYSASSAERPARFPGRLIVALGAALLLAGCDQVQKRLGLEDPVAKAAHAEAEGKAVGGACRHSGRAIEDCYSIYSWLPKDPVFTGWREMDAYMRENRIETIEPLLPPAPPPPPPPDKKKKKKKAEEPAEQKPATPDAAQAEKPAEKTAEIGRAHV